jgi:methionyl-tRNA synthetase
MRAKRLDGRASSRRGSRSAGVVSGSSMGAPNRPPASAPSTDAAGATERPLIAAPRRRSGLRCSVGSGHERRHAEQVTHDRAPGPEPRHVLVAVAWPYANGPLHLGHLAGAYLPADIFARYHRIAGNRVLMVSGSDAHGTPITVRAEQESTTPRAVVERFHPEFLRYWDELGISFDLFTTTMTENHAATTQEVLRGLHANGLLEARTTSQHFDPVASRFLPDRYVEGTCPRCGSDGARGDQCDACGATLDPVDLIEPRSKLTGATPELRETEHYFLLLPKLGERMLAWLESRQGWRPHVINWALGFVREGLQDRAITRDIDWGVALPDDVTLAGAEHKRIYVWFDAVIGYLSASKEWAQRSGDPEAWRAWWEDPPPSPTTSSARTTSRSTPCSGRPS